MKLLGLDIGSTTFKCVVIGEKGELLFSAYDRHHSKVNETAAAVLGRVCEMFPGEKMAVSVSGSAGMGAASALGLPFVQEVYATRLAVRRLAPGTDVVIELGGEDAKMLFLTGGLEFRMNGTCAGGTGAFIDQMASLMDITADEMDAFAEKHEKIYTIASRCGVFAKTDVQPLLNQGARKEDISASIFYAVVSQVIAGLAQGREITGNVLYLGGPLTFLSQLRAAFDDVLKTTGLCPDNSLYFVAIGAAISGAGEVHDIKELTEKVASATSYGTYNSYRPLFAGREDYEAFKARHRAASRGISEIDRPCGEMCLGIDAGSTTVKMVLCDEKGNLFRPFYSPNNGNPIPIIRQYLRELYRDFPDINIVSSAVTGYGEDMIKAAFSVDMGVVETVAHYTAAKKFRPDVDFIIDIGGQDIKCFKIRGGAIDNIYLNEACSSGCGSFLQTFASALGYTTEEFASLALFADAPVDLGSRCTVFMNSSVKQAQKDGASVENISAGLSISVVKNALYKVIRCATPDALGQNIVVQGGTFLNDAVLRAFELEVGRNVIRPAFSALMGAYGAALFAQERRPEKSGIVTAEALESFKHETKAVTCKGCSNNCRLTLNYFGGKTPFIAGNRCDRPLKMGDAGPRRDLFEYKRSLLSKYMKNEREEGKKTVGIPLGLNLYELLPFWHTFFTHLGFNVIVSPFSSRKLYLKGQHTIPSDTVCYPAKLLHGHIEALLDEKPDAIFYPDMSYNIDENLGCNHYNCPVVAYYPQVLDANVKRLRETVFINDFIGLHDPKEFKSHIRGILAKYFPEFSKKEISEASDAAYKAYEGHMSALRGKAQEYLEAAEKEDIPVIVLAGRPYHVDPEINHGIDELICSLGAVVLTEDSVSDRVEKFKTKVMNQWTYHSRLYAAAKFVAEAPEDADINLVQLVSFGCGVDAVTTDETRSIIEAGGKIYTQIKIDEISNMGAVRIRLRSLFAATEGKKLKKAK
ncbi:MAG: 2-hydroxyacyl-CoA dehydratase [Oscillospiraceae bacterium]|nr:2-hydroxyacyl-CoA dehydratase [Oscillospiraceae bacterium]